MASWTRHAWILIVVYMALVDNLAMAETTNGSLALPGEPLATRTNEFVDWNGEVVHVERGTRRPVLDGAGWVVGIPRKVLLWDRRADNHHVSDATVAEVASYLQHRGLHDTTVRVNQYAPLEEWRRLRENHEIAPGWRYTVGSLKWLRYTLVPGRLFGKDEYNPYTNSLYLYSDIPTMGLAEAAYAKDIAERNHPGTYAAAQDLPVVSLWHETLATKEVSNYVAVHGSADEMERVRHDLYARYGLETAGAVSPVITDGGGLFTLVGAGAGHLAAAHQNHADHREAKKATKPRP